MEPPLKVQSGKMNWNKTIISFLFFVVASNLFVPLAKAEFVITFGGDLNLTPSREAPKSDRGCKHGQCYTWSQLFSGIKSLLIGDLNFYNLETVVTDGSRNLSPHGSKFLFQSNIKGVRYAKDVVGLNFASLANNHAGDWGPEGMEETIRAMDILSNENPPMLSHGIAYTREELLKPKVLEFESKEEGVVRVAFAAITFIRNASMKVSQGQPGVIYPENETDMKTLLYNFSQTSADLKILSIHGGIEGNIHLDPGQKARYERFIREGGLDIIVGHHPHRVRPVEIKDNKVIMYSLGNYLMLGASDINKLDDLRDYGLLTRIYFQRDTNSKLIVHKMEAIPLMNVHAKTMPLSPSETHRRIQALNNLTNDELGRDSIEWRLNKEGFGEICLFNCEPMNELY